MAPKNKTPSKPVDSGTSNTGNGDTIPKAKKNLDHQAPLAKNSHGKTSQGAVSPSKFVSVLVAFVAFFGGVLTPPLRHAFQERISPVKTESIPNDNLPEHIPCTKSNLANYLHESPVNGMHIVCIEPITLDVDGKEQSQTQFNADRRRLIQHSNSLRLTIYKGAHSSRLRRRITISRDANVDGGVESISWKSLEKEFYPALGLIPPSTQQQPWAIFTPLGQRIVGVNDNLSDEKSVMTKIVSSEMIILTNGGVWRWPGVREGFKRSVELSPTNHDERARNVTIETLSLQPLVLSIEGFLSDGECDYIAKIAEPDMEYSGVTLKDADKGKAASNWRTSQSTFLKSYGDDTLRGIEERTAELTRVPISHQEHVQVLRYGKTEKYDAHHDYFDPTSYRADPSTLNLIEYGKRNRFATVFWYLTDVEKGGETIFPHNGEDPLPHDWQHNDCSIGLKVKPQKGKVIIFYSLDAMGRMDPLSLHGACPVEEGVKWAANKWVWNAPIHFLRE